MAVSGRLEKPKKLRLRQSLASGEIDGAEFKVSLNGAGDAMVVEFDDAFVLYHTGDMVRDAYEVYKKGAA